MHITVKNIIRDNRIPGIIARFPGAVSAAVRSTAFEVKDSAIGFLFAQKAVDTGTLWRSIEPKIEQFRAEISPHTEYDIYVELGTYKMAARPYMRPSADVCEPKFVAKIDDLVKAM